MTLKTATDFKGVDIREVFDFRLSRGAAFLFNSGEHWAVKIISNTSPDGEAETLAEHVTGIRTNVQPDSLGIKKCYAWLHSVRDDFSRDNIELRKPVVALINASNAEASKINTAATMAQADGDIDLFMKLRGQLDTHLVSANGEIKNATKKFDADILALGN